MNSIIEMNLSAPFNYRSLNNHNHPATKKYLTTFIPKYQSTCAYILRMF